MPFDDRWMNSQNNSSLNLMRFLNIYTGGSQCYKKRLGRKNERSERLVEFFLPCHWIPVVAWIRETDSRLSYLRH